MKKILSAICLAFLVACGGGTSSTPMVPFARTNEAPSVTQTYQRRLYIRNDSKYLVTNMEWYVPECWGDIQWYRGGKALAPGLALTIPPGKEVEVTTSYTPCTSHTDSSIYFIFTVNRSAVDTAAFVLTGSAAGHRTRLWVKTWDATHTHCFCRDNGRCHFVDDIP